MSAWLIACWSDCFSRASGERCWNDLTRPPCFRISTSIQGGGHLYPASVIGLGSFPARNGVKLNSSRLSSPGPWIRMTARVPPWKQKTRSPDDEQSRTPVFVPLSLRWKFHVAFVDKMNYRYWIWACCKTQYPETEVKGELDSNKHLYKSDKGNIYRPEVFEYFSRRE